MLAFVSFDLGHDEPAFGKFIEGSPGCTAALQVEHWSLKSPAGGPEWEKLRRDRISRPDLMIVLVGKETSTADNVLEEIRLAKLSNVPFLWHYLGPSGPCQSPAIRPTRESNDALGLAAYPGCS